MVEQGNYVVGKRGEVQAGFVAERLGRAVVAAVEREQADAGRRRERVGDLVDIAALAVLKDKGRAGAGFPKGKSDAVVDKAAHVSSSLKSSERSVNQNPRGFGNMGGGILGVEHARRHVGAVHQ